MRDPVSPLPSETEAPAPQGAGLSAKLLVLTIVFVMIAEVMIFVPSIANFRNNWISDRLADAELAVAALDPATYGPRERGDTMMQQVVLETLDAQELVLSQYGDRRILAQRTGIEGTLVADLAVDVEVTTSSPLTAIWEAFSTLLGGDRVLRIHGPPEPPTFRFVEVVVEERDLRDAMLGFSRNILILSIFISVVTAVLVYLALNALFVKPLQRLDAAMANFADNPEDPASVIVPSGRGDELGRAEARLASMQTDLRTMLTERRRLADVGLAVSKINHDLRNLLSSAHLLSERLEMIADPHVQRIAPKIVRAIDRAVSFCEATLAYGQVREEAPVRSTFTLGPLVDEVAEFAGLSNHRTVRFENSIDPTLAIRVDRENLFRVLLNLIRNGRHALEALGENAEGLSLSVTASFNGDEAHITVSDTGPGIPEKVRKQLFQPFGADASRRGSTGLGLAIAKELTESDGGTIRLLDNQTPTAPDHDGETQPQTGARFAICLPDARVKDGVV
ncbi:MAG: HAMP domain-containing sensor histidine kinase [Pseudomonadota bacterium]